MCLSHGIQDTFDYFGIHVYNIRTYVADDYYGDDDDGDGALTFIIECDQSGLAGI